MGAMLMPSDRKLIHQLKLLRGDIILASQDIILAISSIVSDPSEYDALIPRLSLHHLISSLLSESLDPPEKIKSQIHLNTL